MLKVLCFDGTVVYTEALMYDELNHRFTSGSVAIECDDIECIEPCDIIPKVMVAV